MIEDIEPSSPSTVAKFTIASSIAGAALTAVYEAATGRFRLKDGAKLGGRSILPVLTASAALNSGFVGFCFFSLREYFVSPSLRTIRRKYDGHAISEALPSNSSQNLTFSALRMQRIPDTIITGAILGGSLNAWKRGPAGIPSGAFTMSFLCVLVQFATNEIRVQRIKFLSRPQQALLISPTESISASEESKTGTELDANQLNRPITDTSNQFEQQPSLSERFFGLLGLKKVSDEEYLTRLKLERDSHLKRIQEIEEKERWKEGNGKD